MEVHPKQLHHARSALWLCSTHFVGYDLDPLENFKSDYLSFNFQAFKCIQITLTLTLPMTLLRTYFRFSKICWMEEYPESLTNQNRCFILQFIDILKL